VPNISICNTHFPAGTHGIGKRASFEIDLRRPDLAPCFPRRFARRLAAAERSPLLRAAPSYRVPPATCYLDTEVRLIFTSRPSAECGARATKTRATKVQGNQDAGFHDGGYEPKFAGRPVLKSHRRQGPCTSMFSEILQTPRGNGVGSARGGLHWHWDGRHGHWGGLVCGSTSCGRRS